MKRILLTLVVLLVFSSLVYSQQSTLPSSAQTRQNAQQYLGQARTNATQYESTLNDLIARNLGNKDLATFNRLKSEIERLETMITREQAQMGATLERGTKVSTESLDRIQRLIDQHRAKLAELDTFISS